MRRLAVVLAAGVSLGLAAAPSALADTSQSSNWAGYAVHRAGVGFRTVSGTWTQPHATCTAAAAGYSSVWVGIGGYNTSSRALEQVGTELDCTRSRHVVSSAWYELVPAASRTVRLTIAPGDRVRASVAVAVAGGGVRLSIEDLTRHRAFARTLHAPVLDTSSAEWILEAPSECSGAATCRTLPLADFGSARFTAASALSSAGHRGSIADAAWSATRITLSETGRRFVGLGGAPGLRAGAAPSALTTGGRAFTVTYSDSSSSSVSSSSGGSPEAATSAVGARAATVRSGGRRR